MIDKVYVVMYCLVIMLYNKNYNIFFILNVNNVIIVLLRYCFDIVIVICDLNRFL